MQYKRVDHQVLVRRGDATQKHLRALGQKAKVNQPDTSGDI